MLSDEDFNKVKNFLGRDPEGSKEVLVRDKNGNPRVIRVSAYFNKTPFPTIYWLVCPILKKRIDEIEASGFIKHLESEVFLKGSDLLFELEADQRRCIESRMNSIKDDGIEKDIPEKILRSFQERGIGGIQKFEQVRCLHMHYAFHLVHGGVVGRLLDEKFQLSQL
ncbi:MAG: DUF501 domain-containing protein [Bacteriovoracaceae bacterium]